MLKKIKNLSKKAKVITTVVFALALFIGAFGVNLYAKEQHRQDVFNAYWSINKQDTTNYNDDELTQYNDIMLERENSFESQNLEVLLTVSNKLTMLDDDVKTRIEKELTEKYQNKLIEVNAISIVDGANGQEIDIFNSRKNTTIDLINYRFSFEEIDKAIATLNNTNTDINNRKENDRIAQEQANNNWNNNNWSGNNSNNSGGGNWNNNNTSNGGNHTPTPQQPSAPPIFENPWSENTCDEYSCWGAWT